jgi:hypothetical protein
VAQFALSVSRCFGSVFSERFHHNVNKPVYQAVSMPSYVHNKLRDYLDANRPMSMPQVFDELRMIKVVKTKGGMALCNPMTKMNMSVGLDTPGR